MKKLTGVFEAKKKNGEIYYRSSITFCQKHISLGSFSKALWAHYAYLEADAVLHDAVRFSIDQLEIWYIPLGENDADIHAIEIQRSEMLHAKKYEKTADDPETPFENIR